MNGILPCLVCKKKLEVGMLVMDAEVMYPRGGVTFTSRGNFGSKVFDPPDGLSSRYLQVHICDDCVVQASIEQLVAMGTVEVKEERRFRLWTTELERSLFL